MFEYLEEYADSCNMKRNSLIKNESAEKNDTHIKNQYCQGLLDFQVVNDKCSSLDQET